MKNIAHCNLVTEEYSVIVLGGEANHVEVRFVVPSDIVNLSKTEKVLLYKTDQSNKTVVAGEYSNIETNEISVCLAENDSDYAAGTIVYRIETAGYVSKNITFNIAEAIDGILDEVYIDYVNNKFEIKKAVEKSDGDIDIDIDVLSDYIKKDEVSRVGKTGRYSDLLDEPTKVSAFENDAKYLTEDIYNESLSDYIKKDEVSTVGKTGRYSDLLDEPTKVSAFENDAKYLTEDIYNESLSDYIKKDEVSTVGKTGRYSDLLDEPTKVSAFENDARYLTSYTETDPTVPYQIGDLWWKNGELYRCIVPKTSSQTFSEDDWAKSKYVDEETFKNTLLLNAVSGNPSKLLNSAGKPLVEFEIEGNSYQETRSGKNLFVGSDTYANVNYQGLLDTDTTLYNNCSIRTNMAWTGAYLNLSEIIANNNLQIGDTLTYSIYIKSNFMPTKDVQFILYRANADTTAIHMMSKNEFVIDEWQRLSFTFTINEYSLTATNARLEANNYWDATDPYYFGNNRTNYIWFSCPQLERGTLTEYELPGLMPSLKCPSEVEMLKDVELKVSNEVETLPIPIDLQGNFIGKLPDETKDRLYLENGHLYLEKKVVKVVFDGNEGWIKSSSTVADTFSTQKLTIKPSSTGMSNYFTYLLNQRKVGTFYIDQFSQCIFSFSEYGNTSVEEWKSWLQELNNNGTPLTMYAELVEPQAIDLGEYSLNTLYGNSTIQLLSRLETDMYCKYIRDVDSLDIFQTKDDMEDYYNKFETDSRISIETDSIVEQVVSIASLVDANGKAIETVNNRVTEEITSTQAQIEVVQNKVNDGVEILKNSLVTININGIQVSTNLSKVSTIMTNDTFAIQDNTGAYLAYFGYDEKEGRSKSEMDNLTVTNYFAAGYHRQEKFESNGEKRTGFFYIGGDI